MLYLNSYVFVLGIIVQVIPIKSQLTQCFSEFCFTIPDSNQMRNFDEAKSWCISNSSTLAVVNDQSIQDALTKFLSNLPSNQTKLMFINEKLQETTSGNTWFLLNGTNYIGEIDEQDYIDAEYRYYIYVENRNRGAFYAYASNPLNTKNYVCEYDENMCSNMSSNFAFHYYGRCYVKYDNESLSWYKARERCRNSGGDLMMFIGKGHDYTLSSSFNTSWLNAPSSYWVGIRWHNRTWFSRDNGPEIVYTSWSNGKPNTFNFECVCVDPNGNPKWSWTDCHCDTQRQFVCLKTVPTTLTTSTPIPTTVASSTLNPPTGVNASSKPDNDNIMKIALGVGIGVGGFIVIIIVAVVVIVVVMKRRKNASTQEQNNDVNKIAKTKTSNKDKVKEEKNDDNSSQMYATVLSSTSPSKEVKESSENTGEVVYTQPEFFGTVKSESPYSDPEDSVTSRSINGDVVSKTRTRTLLPSTTGDIYANVDGAE